MITEQEIDKTIERINKIPEDSFVKDYQDIIQDQEELFKFVVQSAEQLKMEDDAKNAIIELLYNNLSVYKDKFKNKYPIVKEDTIVKILKERNADEQKHAEILGVNLNDESVNVDIEKMYQEINTAIEAGKADKLEGQLKQLHDFIIEQNNKIKQKFLLGYNTYFIGNDELITTDNKPIANMIIDTVVESLEKEMEKELSSKK
jgi:hypothetical protein